MAQLQYMCRASLLLIVTILRKCSSRCCSHWNVPVLDTCCSFHIANKPLRIFVWLVNHRHAWFFFFFVSSLCNSIVHHQFAIVCTAFQVHTPLKLWSNWTSVVEYLPFLQNVCASFARAQITIQYIYLPRRLRSLSNGMDEAHRHTYRKKQRTVRNKRDTTKAPRAKLFLCIV